MLSNPFEGVENASANWIDSLLIEFIFNACPFTPQRPLIAPNPAHEGAKKSHKCDLCLNAPYHFDPEVGGGVEGIQTCVAVCPLKAIQFTTELPADGGYDINLRPKDWGTLGYSMI